jgi:hypothetical protein
LMIITNAKVALAHNAPLTGERSLRVRISFI